jgi:hypothetical protein
VGTDLKLLAVAAHAYYKARSLASTPTESGRVREHRHEAMKDAEWNLQETAFAFGEREDQQEERTMSMGYDVAELLAEIKAKDAELKALVPNNFTETEINLVLDLLCIPLPRLGNDEIVQKLKTALSRLEASRRDFDTTLTDEERQLILKHRAQKRGG